MQIVALREKIGHVTPVLKISMISTDADLVVATMIQNGGS
jgi:hypothetical protein